MAWDEDEYTLFIPTDFGNPPFLNVYFTENGVNPYTTEDGINYYIPKFS